MLKSKVFLVFLRKNEFNIHKTEIQSRHLRVAISSAISLSSTQSALLI